MVHLYLATETKKITDQAHVDHSSPVQFSNDSTMKYIYLSLHLVLSTEGAGIFAVLRDLHLLHSLPQASTVSGAVLSGDSDLLGSLGHRLEYFRLLKNKHTSFHEHFTENI